MFKLKYLIAGALLLLSFVPVFGQEYWSTVAAPKTAPYVQQNQTGHSQVSDYTWKYPYTRPTPAGVIRVYNAIVDADGKIGAWSHPTTLTVKSGWRLWGGAWNQPIIEDAAGIAWKLEIVSVNADDPTGQWQYNPYYAGRVAYLYTAWHGSYMQNTLSPVSSHSPYLQQLTEDAWSNYTIEKIGEGGRYTTVSPAPVVVASSIPHKTYQLAYCRVTETGETALSPAYTFAPNYPAGVTPSDASWLRCTIYEFHPQGTIGLHFYRREQITPETSDGPATWGDWKRLPDAECYGTPSKDANGRHNKPDEWLWPVWKRTCLLLRYVDDAPVHAPSANPQSRLTKLHRLLRGDPIKDKDVLLEYLRLPDTIVPAKTDAEGNVIAFKTQQNYDPHYVETRNGELRIRRTYVGNVIVKPGERFVVTCPVIDEWGNGDSGTTGGVGDQKFERQIRASDFGVWHITQANSQAGQNSWPVVLIHNHKSKWTGANIMANGGDAVCTSDYNGSNCFGNLLEDAICSAPMKAGGRVTVGLRHDHSAGPAHHASEHLYRRCTFNGGIGVVLGGNQSANMRFDECYITSFAPDPRGSTFLVHNPNPIKFYNGCFIDAYVDSQLLLTGRRGTIFRASVYPANIDLSGVWCDQGFVRFIECDNVHAQLKMTAGKLNVRGTKPALGMIAGVTREKSTWLIDGVQIQPDPNTQACRWINLNYRSAEPLLERTGLANLVLREPGEEWATALAKRFNPSAVLSPRSELGYRIEFDVSGTKVNMIYNSLTTGKPVTRELNP